MSKAVYNPPSSDVLMKSIRSIGYSFETAVADIVDNSISAKAKNVYINFPPADDYNYVSILDDGCGMDRDELFNAMKYGSIRESYGENELGRFGLGLKSASTSQCKVFTVASKKNKKINAFRWDLDEVVKTQNWNCLELNEKEIKKLPDIAALEKQKSGTLVIWENFDVAYKKSGGRVHEYLVNEIDRTDAHLRLVFHRFLNNRFNPVHIFINNDKLTGFDPFLEDHPKVDSKKISEIMIDGSIIKVQPYILPHQTDLTKEDIDKLGGIDSLRNKQGFYVYRNNRLIISGTWFRLNTSSISSELYKYGRIKVDIPNSLDDIWEIDIKKQNATIPEKIKNNLKKSVQEVCRKSEEKSSKRTKLTLNNDPDTIWAKDVSINGKDYYHLNAESKYIKLFLEEFGDENKQKLLRFMDSISASLPYDDIYYSICNKKNESELSDSLIDSLVSEGLAQIDFVKKILKCSNKTAYERVVKYEPFNDEKISKLIKERLNHE